MDPIKYLLRIVLVLAMGFTYVRYTRTLRRRYRQRHSWEQDSTFTGYLGDHASVGVFVWVVMTVLGGLLSGIIVLEWLWT